MSWFLLLGLVLGLSLAFLATLSRRSELLRMEAQLGQRERARQGGAESTLQYPVVDLSRCLGCGTCVSACPEEGVLELVHGQAMVVNGARCVGHSVCERECPVGAITVRIADLDRRRDVPVLSDELESISAPGLYLAGEVTAHALIKTAIEHGTRAARAAAARVAAAPADLGGERGLDLCIVGAGPAGLACALEAKRLGLGFVVIEQEPGPGGTVAKYPRQKLVLTQPVELPLHGPLGGGKTTFTKEELVALWQRIVDEEALPIHGGLAYQGCARAEDGGFVVHTSGGTLRARSLCLALGRRGSPRKLGVPGEDLPKVAYGLLDAHSYQGRRIVVVGGGDSAIETALGLAEQPGNEVLLSYRREAFFRLKTRNQERLDESVAAGRLRLALRSEVVAITPREIELEVREGEGARRYRFPNDEVFVLAGGVAPFELLERSGVSCDPALRPPAAPVIERGTGLAQALGAALVLALAAGAWALLHADYYLLPAEARPSDAKHTWLRPGSGFGLWAGVAATALIAINFLYVARRAGWRWLSFGSLRSWMTSHVATGILALLLATLHGAMDPRDTVGGHALLGLFVLLVTGAIGRYLYAHVPRAANGRELELEEVRAELERLGERWDASQRAFVERVRAAVDGHARAVQWRSSFLGRALALVFGRRRFERTLSGLGREGRAAGITPERVTASLRLAREAHRVATAAAHYEDLRGVLSSWRYLHRWVAALMVLLLALHLVYALAYASFTGPGGVGP